jgi:signal peptide peptidase SppA
LKTQIPSGSFLQFLAEPLCLHEPLWQQMFVQHLAISRAQPQAAEQAFDLSDYLPTIDELIIADGVARIPIHGVMVKRSQIWHGWYSSHVIVGSDHWSEVIGDLTNRTDIETLVFDFDTGGGSVAGTERLADAIFNARNSGKNTIAVVNELCASAGLWTASQCDRIVSPASGSIGSLGIYTVHIDDTEMLSEIGIKKTVVRRGKYKAKSERAMTPDDEEDTQRWIDEGYSQFIDAVARGRSRRPEEVMELWGESQLFRGSEAVSNGLADEIGTLQDVLESLKAGRGGRVSISIPPADDPEGELSAMKLNATGQILDSAGKVVGNISELQIDSAGLTKYFAAQSGELIESAVKTAKDAAAETHKAALAEHDKARTAQLDALVTAVGPEKAIAAFKAGDSVEKAKASLADDLALQLKAKDEELAKLKAGGGGAAAAPKFSATDAGGQGDGKPPAAAAAGADKDAPYAAAYEKDGEGFPSLAAYAAMKRFEERQAAK